MKEQQISKAYAKAIISLGKEMKIDVADELTKFSLSINECNNYENLLFLEVFTFEEKMSVTTEVMKKLNLSPIMTHFISFMIQEKRIGLFPLVFKEVIVIDDHNKGFLRGTIEGAEDSLPTDLAKKLTDYIASKVNKTPELKYKKNSKITAGYRVTVEDLQLDASLDNQLEQFKETIINHN